MEDRGGVNVDGVVSSHSPTTYTHDTVGEFMSQESVGQVPTAYTQRARLEVPV